MNIIYKYITLYCSRGTYLGGLAGGWKCADEEEPPPTAPDLAMACDVTVGFLKDAATVGATDPPPDAGDTDLLDDDCCWPITDAAAVAAWWCDLADAAETAADDEEGYDDDVDEWWCCIIPATDSDEDDGGGGGAGLAGMPAIPQLNTRSKYGLASSNEPNWLWISWLCSSSFASSTWNTRW